MSVHESGIYKITNTVNGKVYIGSAANLVKRRMTHFSSLKHGRHKNSKLQRAYDKYGKESFEFSVVLYCDIHNLLMYEQIVIDFFDAPNLGYNIKPIAGSTIGYRHSYESRKKMKAAWVGRVVPQHTEEQKQKISASKKGKKRKPFSEEARKNMSAAHIGKKRRPLSEETKKKISEATKGRKAPNHSPEVLERIRLQHLGAKRSEQARANMKAGWARKKLEKENERL
jgi:group I intron endonuclease